MESEGEAARDIAIEVSAHGKLGYSINEGPVEGEEEVILWQTKPVL
jgi:hypothetical protein